MLDIVNSETFSAMQTEKPFATYKKTILGKIFVQVLSPFNNKPSGELLEGDPKRNDDGVFIDIWSKPQDLYFRKMNKYHFETGNIIQEKRKEKENEEQKIEQYSDDQLKDVLNSKFFTLRAIVDDVKSKAVMFRLIDLGKEIDKSGKIINTLEARLAYLQARDINPEEE